MKKVFVFMFLFVPFICLNAQVKVDLKGKVVRETDRRANRKTDEAIDKVFDKAEEGISSVFKKKDKNRKSENAGNQETNTTGDEQAVSASTDQGKGNKGDDKGKPSLLWMKYDFVPGDSVFFEDNHDNEQNGEFPSRWDLASGGGVENAVFDNQKVIFFREDDASIVPYVKNPQNDYLPDQFTIEFDAWFEKGKYCNNYRVELYDYKNQESGCNRIDIYANGIYYKDVGGSKYPGANDDRDYDRSYWRHIALSFNTRALKVYLDDARLINIPNLGCNPTGFTIEVPDFGAAANEGINCFIKNIRIAEGAVKLYDRLLQDGKIVTNGIKFDVNKATLKPESMGVINTIFQLMKEHPDLNFSVEGHTDSDGEEAYNMTLSENRAKTVVNQLASMGIQPSRLSSKGWGESKPVDNNGTPEGKANNRRVEFIKM